MTTTATTNKFVVFIISHGRPDKVMTYDTIRKKGYKGPVYILVDDLDATRQQYIDKYGDQVVVFDKKKAAAMTDQGDNFNDLRTTTHVRNASFEIAENLGYEFFIVLDDDYTSFRYWFDESMNFHRSTVSKNLDSIFQAAVDFFEKSKSVKSLAFAQGGDYIGGPSSGVVFGQGLVGLKRKAMNSFICSTKRPFKFIGRLNEDVNTYIRLGSVGNIFFTTNHIGLEQMTTQQTAGGMTESYLKYGTYVKSFYTVMYHPSSVKVASMGIVNRRLHHRVDWKKTVPKILPETLKKLI
jgi:hypothetical protein